MATAAYRQDFTTFKGQVVVKTWHINKVVNGVAIPYDMTSKTIVFKAFDRSATPVELFTLSPTAKGNGFVTFTFSGSNTAQVAFVDYFIREDLGGSNVLQLVYGTMNCVDASKYIPFVDIVLNETPPGLTIPENYITIKSYEWRLFLQKAIEPNIADADVNNETAWPTLVNYLIAKLVVYEYLLKQLKSLIAKNSSTDESNATGVKKIETGPSNAEFFDSMGSMSKLLQTGKNGEPFIATFAQEACQLAKRLRIFLPLCNNPDNHPIIPLKQGREPLIDPIALLTDL